MAPPWPHDKFSGPRPCPASLKLQAAQPTVKFIIRSEGEAAGEGGNLREELHLACLVAAVEEQLIASGKW